MKYAIIYMGGTEHDGVTTDWDVASSMEEAVEFMQDIQRRHQFWKVSICEIKETYENQ